MKNRDKPSTITPSLGRSLFLTLPLRSLLFYLFSIYCSLLFDYIALDKKNKETENEKAIPEEGAQGKETLECKLEGIR